MIRRPPGAFGLGLFFFAYFLRLRTTAVFGGMLQHLGPIHQLRLWSVCVFTAASALPARNRMLPMIAIMVTLSLAILALLAQSLSGAVLDEHGKYSGRGGSALTAIRVQSLSAEFEGLGSGMSSGYQDGGKEPQSRLSAAGIICGGLLAFIAGSILYVYRFRGKTRYQSFGQYLRKSWPIFAPFNCLLYLLTKANARGAIVNARTVPELALLKSHWEVIRDEAQALHAAGELEATAIVGSPGYYDVGFRTFYKYGWRKFYLCWYGYTLPSALRTCPRTLEVLSRIPAIHGAMFSFLPPGGALTLHSDPLACSLRYHLGLATPAQKDCFIEVDGERRAWTDGEDFLFDETYPHFARNDTDVSRLILMCDVERPLHGVGRLFNRLYCGLPRLTVVPNTMEDRRGFASALFARLTPWLQRAKALKASNRRLYRVLKAVVNSALVGVILGALLGTVMLIQVIF
jgi:beta-hydroxylase